jgi:type II secretory pathway pseudopilin PulG
MKKNKQNTVSGFVLIEMIIYIALFSIMIGGLIIVAFQLIQSGNKTGSRVVVQEEMNFVLKKIDWLTTGIESIQKPTSGSPTGALEVKKYGSSNMWSVRLNDKGTSDTKDDIIELCENKPSCSNTDFFPLTTVNVHIDSLTFVHLPLTGSTPPEGVTVNLSIDGQTVSFSKYIKI